MYTLALHSPFRSWKKGELPVSPFVSLTIGAHTEDESGRKLLTPQLMTEAEIDYEVNRLIKELEEFRKAAKKELLELQHKMLSE